MIPSHPTPTKLPARSGKVHVSEVLPQVLENFAKLSLGAHDSGPDNRIATREKCLSLIIDLIGIGGLAAFLPGRQPFFDHMTGFEILERDPEKLLERLEMLPVATTSTRKEAH